MTSVPVNHIRAEGKIKNVNTNEDFKNLDKAVVLQTAAKQVRHSIRVRFPKLTFIGDLGCY
jgi:ubiquitin-like modifier-activating enzyme ATG7